MVDLERELNKLTRIGKDLGGFVGNITFNYEEQELVRRVFKSVFSQLKSSRDKETAKMIFIKTRWIDG